MQTDTQQPEATATAEAKPDSPAMNGSDMPTFELYEYNPRRHARGKEAASVRVSYPDGSGGLLWMSPKNIRDNLKEFGESKGLRDALEAYRTNEKYPNDSSSPAAREPKA